MDGRDLAPCEDLHLGRVIAVSACQAVALLEKSHATAPSVGDLLLEMDSLVKMRTRGSIVYGMVTGLRVPLPSLERSDKDLKLVELDLVGAALADRYALCKERLLGVPGKIGDELSHRERGDVVEILRREIHDALNELSTPSEVIREAGGQPAGAGPNPQSDRSGTPGIRPPSN